MRKAWCGAVKSKHGIQSIHTSQAINAIAAMVRQALAGKVERRRATSRGGGAVVHGTRQPPAASPSSGLAADLSQVVTNRIQELKPDASDYAIKVIRLLVEAAMGQACGAEMINATRFQGLVDRVPREILAAPQLRADIELGLTSFRRQCGVKHPP